MPPAKAGGKEALVLQCEWEVCAYVASKMEEFCEHVAQHLQQHLPGEQRDEVDPLGKELAAWAIAAREPSLFSEMFHCERIFLSLRRAAGWESHETSRGACLHKPELYLKSFHQTIMACISCLCCRGIHVFVAGMRFLFPRELS